MFARFKFSLALGLIALLLVGFSASTAVAQPAPETIASQIQPLAPLAQEYGLSTQDLNVIYASRDHKPIWNTEGRRGRKGIVTFVRSLKDYALFHGLNYDALPFNDIALSLDSQKYDYDHLTLELLVTDLLVKLTRRIRGDDLDLSTIYRSWTFPRPEESYLPRLVEATHTGKLDPYFKSLVPQHMKYKRLALILKMYRAINKHGGWEEIPHGETIKTGFIDRRLPLIHERLRIENYDVPQDISTTYTTDLQEVVIMYQMRNGLEPDGEIGGKTLRAMNLSADYRMKQIMANMERIRQQPHSYEGRRIEVNSARAWLKLFDDKEITYEAPVVLGMSYKRTPFINSEIKTLVLNPSWYVPSSIAKSYILKNLQENPLYLQEMGYNIEGEEEDPQGLNIDWANMKPREFNYFIRQSPSDDNALGKVKFNFFNKHTVYLHGTPKLELFDEADRHLSSGCVRLKDPIQFAEMMLEGNVTKWDSVALENKLSDGKTQWLTVVSSPPIQIVYDSVYFPSETAPVYFTHDIYKRDRKLIKVLFQQETTEETIKSVNNSRF